MLIIGLTGGAGSGKTTATNYFSELGIPIIDADVIARELVEPNKPAYHDIIKRFGKIIVKSDKTLNRQALRQLILANSTERLWLENLLHPLIRDEIKSQAKALTAPYCILSIPLLAESGAYEFIDRILLIDASEETQKQRLKTRDNMNDEKIKQMLAAQASREERLAIADDVILNDGDTEVLHNAVADYHQRYLTLASS